MKTLTIYKSSAGSGKTYTLVFEYLKLVLQNPAAYKHVLAVTFTNKATDEMKQRIVATLIDITNLKQQALVIVLAQQTGIDETQIVTAAQAVLNLILHNYDAFAIQTIDSFFSKTTKALARELNLPLDAETELNQKKIQQQITSSLIDEVGKNELVSKILIDFVKNNIEEDKDWNVSNRISDVSDELFKENYDTKQKLISFEKIDELKAFKKSFEKEMARLGQLFLTTIKNQNLTISDFKHKGNGVAGYFVKISKRCEPDDYTPGVRFLAALNDDVWFANSAGDKSEIDTKPFNQIAKQVSDYYDAHATNYFTTVCILKLALFSLVLDALNTHLKTYRAKNNILLMHDINNTIAHFISASDTPFIYEKTGNRYQHFLIDEFQDTSNIQWNNFLPLIENAMSMGYKSLVVGDVKQSIYRWRGGNMQLLHKKIFSDMQHMSHSIDIKNLNTNYRSKEAIVQFNNSLFAGAPAAFRNFIHPNLSDLLNDTYYKEQVYQQTAEKNIVGGYVNISFLNLKNNSHNDDVDNEAETTNFVNTALESMLNNIHALQKQNYTLGDIAILVRTNSDGEKVAEFLLSNGIEKVITSDSLSLKGNSKVELLIAALQYAYTDNEVALHTLYIHYNQCREQFTMPDFSNTSDISHLLNFIETQKQLHLYSFFENVAAYTGLFNTADVYVQRLLDVVLAFCETNLPIPQLFLDYWQKSDAKELNVVLPADANSINIITLHKSKGLQFPVVLMPLINYSIKPKHKEIIWAPISAAPFNDVDIYPVYAIKLTEQSHFQDKYAQEKSLMLIDNINMLYVAFTRAEQQLFITAQKTKDPNTLSLAGCLLELLIRQQPEWHNQIQENNTLEIGKPFENADKRKITKLQYLPHFLHQPFYQNLSVRSSTPNNLVFENAETGKVIHAILASIKTVSEIKPAIEKSKLDTSEKIRIRKQIDAILNLPETANWFDGSMQVFNEQEIVLPDGQIKRPDRLMLKNNNVIVVDYKTGLQQNTHIKQIADYDYTLQLMGYNVSERYLLYLSPLSLVRC